MNNLLICLNAVLPIFLIMALGYTARSLGFIDRGDVPKLNKLAFRFFMPLMLFSSIYSSELDHAIQPRLLLIAAIFVLAEYIIALIFVLLTEKDNSKRGVKIQGIYRSNFVIIGIPLASELVSGADVAPVVILVAVVVPMFNVLAVVTLEVFNGKRPKLSRLLLDILKNPLILGTAAGLTALFLDIKLPSAIISVTSEVGAATNPLLLFLLGAFFDFGGLRRYSRDLITVCLGRLVVMPAIFLTISMLLGIRGVEFAGMIAIFGSATAIASFTMTQQMGGDAELAGDIVVATSAFCSLTMFMWALIFKSLGAF